MTDEEWAFLAPYLTLMREDAPQRTHPLRELFNGLRFIARMGLQWRFMPTDLPPWHAVYDKTRGWIAADVFSDIIADLRELIRMGQGRSAQPAAAILDSRTLQSTPESGARAGCPGGNVGIIGRPRSATWPEPTPLFRQRARLSQASGALQCLTLLVLIK